MLLKALLLYGRSSGRASTESGRLIVVHLGFLNVITSSDLRPSAYVVVGYASSFEQCTYVYAPQITHVCSMLHSFPCFLSFVTIVLLHFNRHILCKCSRLFPSKTFNMILNGLISQSLRKLLMTNNWSDL